MESKSVPSLGASSADFRGLIPRNNAQQVGHHALRQPRAERSAVDGSNALQPEAVIEAGPRKHGIDENLLLDINRLLTAESKLLRCPQIEENARTCALFSSFRQRRRKSRTAWRSAVNSNSQATSPTRYIESKPASLAPHSIALYEHLQHLVSTLIDLQHALVAIELFNHRSLQITCTAEYL